MRRIVIGSALVLAATLFIGSHAGADYYDYELDGSGAPQVGVEYTIGNGTGELTVLGGAGLDLAAFDAAGAPIAGTVIFDSVTSVTVPVTTDSSTLHVRVGDQWYQVSTNDPDWGFD